MQRSTPATTRRCSELYPRTHTGTQQHHPLLQRGHEDRRRQGARASHGRPTPRQNPGLCHLQTRRYLARDVLPLLHGQVQHRPVVRELYPPHRRQRNRADDVVVRGLLLVRADGFAPYLVFPQRRQVKRLQLARPVRAAPAHRRPRAHDHRVPRRRTDREAALHGQRDGTVRSPPLPGLALRQLRLHARRGVRVDGRMRTRRAAGAAGKARRPTQAPQGLREPDSPLAQRPTIPGAPGY